MVRMAESSQISAALLLARGYEPNTDKGEVMVNLFGAEMPDEVMAHGYAVGNTFMVPAWVLSYHSRGLQITPPEKQDG